MEQRQHSGPFTLEPPNGSTNPSRGLTRGEDERLTPVVRRLPSAGGRTLIEVGTRRVAHDAAMILWPVGSWVECD
jgi:hypothetical protein